MTNEIIPVRSMREKLITTHCDDYTVGDEGTWTQLCSQCVCTYGIDESRLSEMSSNDGTCGVKGCMQESVYYYDLVDNEQPLKNMHYDQLALFDTFVQFQKHGREDGCDSGIEVTEEDLLEAWRAAKAKTNYFKGE